MDNEYTGRIVYKQYAGDGKVEEFSEEDYPLTRKSNFKLPELTLEHKEDSTWM